MVDVVERALTARKEAYEAEKHNRCEMVDDLKFAALDQWPDDVKEKKKDSVMLTLDHVNQGVRSVIGDMQENRPSVKAIPVDDGADIETAKVFSGLIRHIEQTSNATDVYMHAARSQVKCGYGVWRISNEFASHDVFEQDLFVRRVKNPLNWWFDPTANEVTKHDGRWVVGLDGIPKDVFGQRYPDVLTSKEIDQLFVGEGYREWTENDDIIIAEFYEKVPIKKEIALLSTGVTVEKDMLDATTLELMKMNGVSVIKERRTDSFEIHYHKVTGIKAFEHRVLPYQFFPVIPVFGEVENIEGQEFVRGLVRPAKDAQRMYNYMNSTAVELMALQPKSPFIGTAEMFAQHKALWNRANQDAVPFLPYTPDPLAPGGKPERSSPPIASTGHLQQAQLAADDIRSAMGVHEASLGEPSNEVSGRAILARQQGSQMGNSIYMANLSIAVEHTGKVLVDMIPYFYDTMRTIRITGENGIDESVTINRPYLSVDGQRIENDLTRGKYDVRLVVGPSYRTRRVEAVNTLMEMIRVFPQLSTLAGDILAKNLDIPYADELEERLRKTLPPGLVEEKDPQKQAARQVQQQQQQQLAQQQLLIQVKDALAKIDETISKTQLNKAKAASELEDIDLNKLQFLKDLLVNTTQSPTLQ